ncbi:MAG: hypothetical protein V2B18_17450 [Pseudomonadota bacterium]
MRGSWKPTAAMIVGLALIGAALCNEVLAVDPVVSDDKGRAIGGYDPISYF